jgi:pimeloyl-ACP methyl ester carboxylesterase
MLIRDHYVHYQGSRLHYAKGGSGARKLLMFHGFGQGLHVFQDWLAVLEHDFTLYAFDLYFHGQSDWPSREPLEKTDWRKILDLFFAQENIQRFELVGFSMGGKFVLATVEAYPDRVDRVVLIAPDGIKTNFWYSLATYPIATRALFRSMILKPDRLYRIIKTLRALQLVDKGILRFAESQMNTEEKRKRVYFTWVYFRHLKFNLTHIQNLVNTRPTPVLMITGRYDKIITTRNMQQFVGRLTHAQFVELEAGHNDLIEKAAGIEALRSFRQQETVFYPPFRPIKKPHSRSE